MKFTDLIKLIDSFLCLKKQYPILFSYSTYLKTLSKPDQDKELNLFMVWLSTNPQISNQILDNPKFVSSAKGKVIFFDTIFKLADEPLKTKTWSALQNMCHYVNKNPSVTDVFNKLQHNAMIKELIHDLDLDELTNNVDIENLSLEDIDEILFSPQLMPTLLKLRDIISSEKYDYKKFIPLLKTTIHDLKHSSEIEKGSRETLSVLDTELKNLTEGKDLNINKVVTSLKQDPLINQTSFSSFLESFQ